MTSYSIQKRQKKNLTHYYVQFTDESGRYGNAKSVDALAKMFGERKHVSKIAEAHAICKRAIEQGLSGQNSTKRHDESFVTYCLRFWNWNESEVLAIENKLNPNSVHEDYARNCMSIIQNHVKPVLSPTLKCSELSAADIEKVMHHVLIEENLSNQTWKNISNAIKRPVDELRRKRILLIDPFFEVKKVKGKPSNTSSVGALTKTEVNQLLTLMYNDTKSPRKILVKAKSRSGNEYTYEKDFRLDERAYYASLLASATGMRMGEIRALRTSSIRFFEGSEVCIINVDSAFAQKAGFKSTKSGKSRQVPCPRWICEEILDFAERNPWKGQKGQDLIFFSDDVPNNPFDKKAIWRSFRLECEAIGIDCEARKITFHSLRHTWDSQAVDSTDLDAERIRLALGHSSKQMTERYYASSDETILSIGKQTYAFVKNPSKEKEAK